MKIDRKKLVARHNPVLKAVELSSPLSVGNGEFAFTADPTGLQTLYEKYCEAKVPLCTMAQWGWHRTPADGKNKYYRPEDVTMTEYDFEGRTVTYAVEKKPGNEAVYDWLRQNPHRLNLARIGFQLYEQNILPSELSGIHQELKLYDGFLDSRFLLAGESCRVKTACDPKEDTLAVSAAGMQIANGSLTVVFEFPYGDPGISASNWDYPERHTTRVVEQNVHSIVLQRTLDRTVYYVKINAQTPVRFSMEEPHRVRLTAESGCDTLEFTAQFSAELPAGETAASTVFTRSSEWWNAFWEQGGAVDFSGSTDPRANELERRVVLSQYLLAIHCSGSMPPQETGLFCNSWYGKFHLEMTFWHCANFALWNRTELLERCLPWYLEHLDDARRNAARNGYPGARWPKMVAYDAIDSPSPIATLLIWQQPHILFLLELVYRSKKSKQLLKQYWDVVRETADFMAGFAVRHENGAAGEQYDLMAPIIPVQEEYDPHTVKNPAFETEYWGYGLNIALQWAKRLGKPAPENWAKVAKAMAPVPQYGGLYLAHDNCPDTFEHFHRDHPSMLGAFGLLPGKRLNQETMLHTLDKVTACWDYNTLWGWDFAMMAMTAVRLGDPEKAVELLLCDTAKNQYEVNGHNFQMLRDDLPAYLPGNGGLLLAIAMMTAGYDGCKKQLPGFPEDGKWVVRYESIAPLP